MKNSYLLAFFLLALCNVSAFSQPAAKVKPFIGRWALSLPNDGAGWLEVRQENDYMDADLLLYGGSVEPCASVYLEGDVLVVTRLRKFVRVKDNEGKVVREHTAAEINKFRFKGNQLIGEQILPERDGSSKTMQFTGKKIPDVPSTPNLSKIKLGKPVKIFNGIDLSGWKLTNPKQVNGWKVIDGALVNDPVQEEGKPHISYGNLRTEPEFEDFILKLQVNVPAKSNSGIYLRGIYEIQVLDSYGKPLDSHNMGAVYSRITPTVAAEKPADTWQDVEITLCDRHVTVVLNGKKLLIINHYTDVPEGHLRPTNSNPDLFTFKEITEKSATGILK